jgi:hypothetical protein
MVCGIAKWAAIVQVSRQEMMEDMKSVCQKPLLRNNSKYAIYNKVVLHGFAAREVCASLSTINI